ncbi:MAG TPA: hypothetical protein VKU61_05915 [Candidatus Binatia bacterium]|nr:hypothetical protein [Candidatus Binatia bacterium]
MRPLALVLLLCATAHAAVEIHARAEPDSVTIGTRFRYVVDVVATPDAEVFVEQPADHIGDFEIVDFGIDPPVQRDGKTVLTRWYRLVGWTPGEHLVKSPTVHYRTVGQDEQEAPAQEIRVSVESMLAKEPNATDVRDIAPPEPIPVDWRPYWLLGGALLLAVALAALLHRVLNRPRRAGAAPPPTPHEVAARALADLKRRNLPAEGAFKDYYSTLSDIVRVYLEQRFRLRAPEMTTEEFLLATARDGWLERTHRQRLGEFLVESDLVKFARHRPTIADADRAWEAAARFVEETSRRPEELRAAG